MLPNILEEGVVITFIRRLTEKSVYKTWRLKDIAGYVVNILFEVLNSTTIC